MNLITVYAIIFAYIYSRDFGLGVKICEGLISWFSDVFITINRHKLKWKFLRGLTHKIHENKTKNNYVFSNYRLWISLCRPTSTAPRCTIIFSPTAASWPWHARRSCAGAPSSRSGCARRRRTGRAASPARWWRSGSTMRRWRRSTGGRRRRRHRSSGGLMTRSERWGAWWWGYIPANCPYWIGIFLFWPLFLQNLSVVMYRKFRNIPIFKDFPLICPYFLSFTVGTYGVIFIGWISRLPNTICL